jgi:hypothetical protein
MLTFGAAMTDSLHGTDRSLEGCILSPHEDGNATRRPNLACRMTLTTPASLRLPAGTND